MIFFIVKIPGIFSGDFVFIKVLSILLCNLYIVIMEKIDIQNFKKYYRNNDGNSTLARVGHVNAVIDDVTTAITRDYVAEPGTNALSGLNKIENYNVTIQGTKLDIYNLQAFVDLKGTNNYAYPIGYITTSALTGAVPVSDKSVVFAIDSALSTVSSPLSVSALVRDTGTGNVIPVTFMTVNIDNTVTTPDEYYIFLTASDPTVFECNLVVDMEIAVEAGSTVEYTVA